MKCPHCGFSWDEDEWEDEEKPIYYVQETTNPPNNFIPRVIWSNA